MWEGERWGAGEVGGERPRLRGPHSAALWDSWLFFSVPSLLCLCLSPCLSLSFCFCFGFSFCPHLCFCLFLCLWFCLFLSLCFCHSVSPYLSLPLVSISLRVSSCLLAPAPAVTRVVPPGEASGEAGGRRARAGLGRSARRGVSKGGAASPAAGGWGGGERRPGAPGGASGGACGAQRLGGGRAPLPAPNRRDLPPLNRFSFAQRPELKASEPAGA